MDMSKEDVLKRLEAAVFEYNTEEAEARAEEVVRNGIDIMIAVEMLTDAMRDIGDRFSSGELFIPELVLSGKVMSSIMGVFDKEIKRSGLQVANKGTVLLGTVKGDLHSIGKSMVGAFCRAIGFKVIDLGEDVPTERFVEEVKKQKPVILGMSALLSTTMVEQEKVIRALESAKVRDKTKIIIGGAPVTSEYAEKIGADGYASTAPRGAELALDLIKDS